MIDTDDKMTPTADAAPAAETSPAAQAPDGPASPVTPEDGQPDGADKPGRTDKSGKPVYASLTARKAAICAAAAVAVVFFLWGMLFFLRPAVSETEKRELTPFPTLTWDGFLNGDWTEGISLWYADTFPGRDGLTSAWHGIQSLFGIRDEQFRGGEGDDVPDDTMGVGTGSDPAGEDEPGTLDPNEGGNGETVQGVYVKGDTAYELYYFRQAGAERYAAVIRKAGERLRGKAEVYDMIVPLSCSFYLGTDVIENRLHASDCTKAARYIYSGLGDDIKTVDVTSALMAHRDEYIFFRTDHHWTATGAYYAYAAFCREAGLTPTALSAYEKLSFDGFLGTLYAEAEQPAALAKNPDTVEAYVPLGTNSMVVYEKDGTSTASYPIVRINTDKYYASAGGKYNCFVAGDHALYVIHNESVAAERKGTSVLLVKESFGNAMVPFLVDSYEYIYVIDYRTYAGEPVKAADGTITLSNADLVSFVEAHDVGTVIFLNNSVATTAEPRLNEMEKFVK